MSGDVEMCFTCNLVSSYFCHMYSVPCKQQQQVGARLGEAFAKLDLASGKPCAQLRETEIEIETATKTETET